MPVRNAAATVAAALSSLASQTRRDFELVLVDDGCTDRTLETARSTWGADPRLRVVESGGTGLIEALRIGLAACRGDLVARMDADDLAEPQRLAEQAALLVAQPEVAVVGSLVQCFSAAPLGHGYRVYETWLNGLLSHDEMMRDLFVESPLAHPSVMFRKPAIEALGGYRDQAWPEDYDLWLRAAHAGLRFAKVPEVLLHWRDHAQRHSRQHARYDWDAFLRCKAHHLAHGPLSGRRDVVVWGAGPIGRRLAKHLHREGASLAAFVDIDPRKIGRVLHDMPVVEPVQLEHWPERFVVAAVGAPGARQLIRRHLVALERREGIDFLCAA